MESSVPLFSRKTKQVDGKRAGEGGLGDYQQPPAGLVEKAIALEPLRTLGEVRSTYQALKSYDVRDFGQGLEAVEAVLQHVLRNKLGFKNALRSGLWPRTVTLTVDCAIRHAASGRSFDDLAPDSVAAIDGELAEREPERVADIERYARALADGEILGDPVYVTGEVLNLAMGKSKASPRAMYMLDGARRVTAAARAHRTHLSVKLIVAEGQLPDFVEAERVDALRRDLEGLVWFENYQSLPLVGLHGERTLERFDLMDMDRLQDQVVLDFGCNVGGASLKAVQAGAARVVGIEGMTDTHALAGQIAELVGFPNLSYLNVNFNDADFDEQIDAAVPHKVDYAFFFSVYRTKELTQRERLFRYIIDKTTKGIFFEGHADAQIDTPAYHAWLFDCFGLKGRFLGNSEGALRPLYYLDLSARDETPSTPA